MKYDILIKNGIIFDGTAKDAFMSSLGIKNVKIIRIGNDILDKDAKNVINASNKYVCPGFIDINNSADHYLGILNSPKATNLLSQGITTIILGHCGASLAPIVNGKLDFLNYWTTTQDINISWNYVDEFLKYLHKIKVGVNVGTLIGWNTIRQSVVGPEFKPLTKDNLDSCLFLLKESLLAGGMGVSFGLAYPNQQVVGLKEMIEASKLVTKYNGLVSIHLRSESEKLLEAVDEVIDLARKTNANIEITHFKAYGKPNWPLFAKAIAKIKQVNETFHTNINFDIYPYELTAESLYLLLPEWLSIGDEYTLRKNLEDTKIYKNLLKILKNKHDLYANMFFAANSSDFVFGGKTLKQVAKQFNLTIEQTLLKILSLKPKQILVYDNAVSNENIQMALKSPYCIVSSNSTIHNTEKYYSDNFIHPRAFGTFPRLFDLYVKELSTLSFKEAIYKCTGLPSKKLNLKTKGIIKLNNDADIVIFNPQTIKDTANIKNPFTAPKGIETVIVNGKLSIHKGQPLSSYAGQILSL